MHELSLLSSCSREKPSRDSENERERQKNLADLRAENQKHEFQADSDRRSIQENEPNQDSSGTTKRADSR